MSRDQLPGNYIRSKTGAVAYLVLTKKRDPQTGAPLVRLRFPTGVVGSGTFTVAQLEAEGAVFIKRRPAEFRTDPAAGEETGKKRARARKAETAEGAEDMAGKKRAKKGKTVTIDVRKSLLNACREAGVASDEKPIEIDLEKGEAVGDPVEDRKAAKTTRPSRRQAKALPSVGTTLTGKYKGATHEVTVVEGGVAWNGSVYRSLSAAGCAITGRPTCNGWAFFGLAAAKGGAA